MIGHVVGFLGIEKIREIYCARTAPFGLIVADGANLASRGDISNLRMPLLEIERAYQAGNLNSYVQANVDFSGRNTQLASKRTAKRILDSLLLRMLKHDCFVLNQTPFAPAEAGAQFFGPRCWVPAFAGTNG